MEKLSLGKKIEAYVKDGKEFTLQELYKVFGSQFAKHSIRARVYESNKVIRTGRGSYILAGIDIEAVIERADSKEHVYRLVDAKLKYDMIFLDIPYFIKSAQHGGNRTLVDYATITPIEFKAILVEVSKLLRTESSQVYFMISGGKSSTKEAQVYINMFSHTGLKLVAEGSYTKLTKSGRVANMGKYDMPPELIFSYSKSGKERFEEMATQEMHYRFQRPALPRGGGYRTEKPLGLLQSLIKRATVAGEAILDLFVGSGVTLEAGLSLGRKVHGVEISEKAIKNHALPRLRRFEGHEPRGALPTVQTLLF